MSNLAEVKFYLSGGATGSGNTLATVSLGGVLTTTEVLSQLATVSSSPISGVTLGNAAGNTLGVGTLTYTYSATAPTLQWTPYSGSIGTAVDVTTSGTYALAGGSSGGVLVVTVDSTILPGANKTDSITITAQDQKIFDDVTKVQSDAGFTDYRCIFVKNTGTVATTDDKIDFEFWISQNTPGADTISIGLAAEAPSTGAGTSGVDYPAIIATESTAPAGVTFSSPTTDVPLATFDLSSTAGSTYTKAIWLKRTVPAGTYTSYTANNFVLGFRAKV